jgi:hypothetical protein
MQPTMQQLDIFADSRDVESMQDRKWLLREAVRRASIIVSAPRRQFRAP